MYIYYEVILISIVKQNFSDIIENYEVFNSDKQKCFLIKLSNNEINDIKYSNNSLFHLTLVKDNRNEIFFIAIQIIFILKKKSYDRFRNLHPFIRIE